MIEAVTVTSVVTTDAHATEGVKVYVVVPSVAVLIEAGLHEPAMPLVDMDGKAGAADPMQSGPIVLNTGVAAGLTVTLSVVEAAH